MLFADTEPAEDLAQEIVRAERAGDAGKLIVRKPQFLGKELPATLLERCPAKVCGCGGKRSQMPLACQER
jgi:hypothetical protein